MANFTNQSKNTTTFSNQSKNSTTFTNIGLSLTNSLLLLEDAFHILLEDGFKIILEQSVPGGPTFTNLTKN